MLSMQAWARFLTCAAPDNNYKLAANKLLETYWAHFVAPRIKYIVDEMIKSILLNLPAKCASHMPATCASLCARTAANHTDRCM